MKFLRLSLLIIFIIFIIGCWNPFAPRRSEDPNGVSNLLKQTTPRSVISNLRDAYQEEKIDWYSACLSQEFLFHPLTIDRIDIDGDGEVDNYWTYSEELQFTTELFNDENISSISLNFPTVTTMPDSTSTEVELSCSFNLQVYTINEVIHWADGFQKFVIRLEEGEETTTNEDDIWRIVDWYDESNVNKK